MNTSRRLRHERINKLLSTKPHKTTKTSWLNWRGALTGLLLICVSLTAACTSNSRTPVAPQDLTVDASLMVKPNLTNQLLETLSK
ncbi:hypothetical protein AA219_004454 [Salmonella enterica subsp. enterica serovar Newport]|nr:hypothetical protein [Salmonella enterica subsp. enterica serovar Newport]